MLELLQEHTRRFPDYEVVVTGHSLGAGVGALLATKLRFGLGACGANVHAYLFAPPCMATLRLAESCGRWTTSVVVERDMVARTSVINIDHLITDLSQTGMSGAMRGATSKIRSSISELWATTTRRADGDDEALPEVLERRATQEHEQHFPPGRLVHVEHARHARPTLLCARNDDYDRILVSLFGTSGGLLPLVQSSLAMVADHFPDLYLLALVRSALAGQPVESEATVQLKTHLIELLDRIPAMPDRIPGDNTS